MKKTGIPSHPILVSPEKTVLERPDPEVPEKRKRRRFNAQYKLRILNEIDSSNEPGHVGSVLRREGLYSSHIRTWRRQRDTGMLQGLAPKKRGRKARNVNPLAEKVVQLERENRRLAKKLKQAEIIIEVQKKISDILGIQQPSSGEKL